MTDKLAELSDIGVSIWLDDLSRTRLRTGNLQELIDRDHIVGVTTNPAIFSAAIGDGTAYSDQLSELAAKDVTVDDAVFEMIVDDVRDAADVLMPIYEKTNGEDGRVSIEVDPRYSADMMKTIEQAKDRMLPPEHDDQDSGDGSLPADRSNRFRRIRKRPDLLG